MTDDWPSHQWLTIETSIFSTHFSNSGLVVKVACRWLSRPRCRHGARMWTVCFPPKHQRYFINNILSYSYIIVDHSVQAWGSYVDNVFSIYLKPHFLFREQTFSSSTVRNFLERSISWLKSTNQTGPVESASQSDWSVLIRWSTVLNFYVRSMNWKFVLRSL
jgi:hypothetical protein